MTPKQIADLIDPEEDLDSDDPEFFKAMEKYKQSLEDEGEKTQKVDPNETQDLPQAPRDVAVELLAKQRTAKERAKTRTKPGKRPYRKLSKSEFGDIDEIGFDPHEEPGDWTVDLEWIQRIADTIED